MTIGRRGHVGWEVRCDARGCQATTATQVPAPGWRRNSDRALQAARTLGWISVTIEWRVFWVCPMHQTWDPRLGRWVVTPMAVRA